MTTSTHRLTRANTALLVVDLQERLLPAIFERERVLKNAVCLARGAQVLGLPIYLTEQYRKGLGPTVPEMTLALPGITPVEKMTFSACATGDLLDRARAAAIANVVVCVVETHVCVCQTCLDLLDHGFHPHVVADAVSSRTPENWRLGLERMREAGATLVSTEMVLFELLGQAGTPEFKDVLSLVK
jgi:nicotinamidase-related amidase